MKKVLGWIVALIVIGGLIGACSDDNVEEKEQKPKTEKKENKPEKKEEKTEEVKTEESTTEEPTEEVTKENDNITPEFRDVTLSYMEGLEDTYTQMSTLSNAKDEYEMMAIIKVGQSKFDDAQQYMDELAPQNEKEKKLYGKLIRINGLTESALLKAEDGLVNEDIATIESATEDIYSATDIINTLNEELI